MKVPIPRSDELTENVKMNTAKPKTVEDVLGQIEHDTGVEVRREFEGFLPSRNTGNSIFSGPNCTCNQ
jgi:hypothetical protein